MADAGAAPPAPVAHAPETGDRRLGYLLVAPVLVLLLAITGYPLVYNIWNSFHFDNLSYGGLPHKFTGVKNYKAMFDRRSGCRRWSGRWCSPRCRSCSTSWWRSAWR